MIQYPINFYPDGNTFDPRDINTGKISFIFKGDKMVTTHFRVYNYDTESFVKEDYTVGASAYNGKDVSAPLNFFESREAFPIDKEYRYIVQCLITQGNAIGSPVFDRFVLRGEINEDYEHGTDTNTMMIEDKIHLIYEWNVDENNICRPTYVSNELVAGIVMKIGNEQRVITAYNFNSGQITLESAFENDYPKGTPYQLYSSYLITQQYFFKTIPEPSFTNIQAKWAGASGTANGVQIVADYNLNEYNPIKYYTVTMEKQNGADIDEQPRHYYKIYETEKIYSQNIAVKFIDDYDVDNEFLPEGNSSNRRYLFTINAVLQNGMTIQSSFESQAPERIDETGMITDINIEIGKYDNYYNVTHITWTYHEDDTKPDLTLRIYRYNMDSNNILRDRRLIASIIPETEEFIDASICTHGKYRYVIVPFQRTFGYAYTPIVTDEVSIDEYGYTITELINMGSLINGKDSYRIGESWHLRADVEDTTVVQNTDKTLHVGYGKYSSVTHTATNYMSSTFNGALVQPNCEGEIKWRDDIELVKAWRDFITRDCIYLLRSQKGDVWVVNIVDNPTTSYVEKYKPIPTNVSFSWAECVSIDDIMVVSGDTW